MTNSRKRLFISALALCFGSALYLTQCREKAADNNTNTSTTASPEIIKTPIETPSTKIDTTKKIKGIAAKYVSAPVDTLFVDVDSKGITYLGNEKMDADFLSRRLVDSLITLKKQSGHYPHKIKLRTRGEVLMGVRGEIQDVIQSVKDSLKIK